MPAPLTGKDWSGAAPDTRPDPTGPYTVWANYHTEGWSPSDPFDTLDECFRYITGTLCGGEYRITRDVHVELREKTA